MPTGTFFLISSQTLSSSASSVTFSSIPQTYKNLFLISYPCATSTSSYSFRINGITTNYVQNELYTQSTSFGTSAWVNGSAINSSGDLLDTVLGRAMSILELPNYTTSWGYNKAFLLRKVFRQVDKYGITTGYNYNDAAINYPITSIAINASGTFDTGSKFYLYGETGV